MSIFYTNKTITMGRGDSGVVLLSILNRDDTPFALPIGMKNPTIVFSVKAETDANDLNSNMLIEEYMPIADYTYYGYGTQNADGQMRIHGGFYPKSKTVNTEESVLDTGIIYKVLANKKYMFVVPTTTPPEYPIGLTKREYAFAVPLVFEPAFTDRLSPGTYTYSITLLDSTSPVRFQQGEGTEQIDVDNYSEFLKNVTLKQDLFGPQKLVLSDSPIARVHGEPIRRIYYIQPCSEASVANATASEITTGNITSIALPPVYIATAEQLGGIIVGQTLQVDFRGVLNVSKAITDKIADLYAKIGDMTQLTTEHKDTLVGAINEVDAHADNAQQTADNATELANTGISKAEQAQATANSAVDKANTAVGKANEAIMKADAKATSIGFMTAKDAVTALNGYPRTQLKGGDTIWIVESGTPDLWVTEVAQESVPYNYTTKDKFNQDLVDNTVLQIGYFKTAYQESDGKPVTIAWQNVKIKTTDWVASTEFEDFPYEAKIELTDFVDYKTVPQVVFDIADTMSGNYAPICKSGDKCVYIYGKVNTAITLKTVITFAPNVNGASVTGGGYNNRGKWVASTTYTIDDLVYTDNGQYVCIEGITSTTSPDDDTTHWQASFVATAGTTENGLKISGQNGNGTEVQKTFDGSAAMEVAFDENDFTLTETNGVLEVKTNTTVPEALPQTASALKSGNLPTSGWTIDATPLWEGDHYSASYEGSYQLLPAGAINFDLASKADRTKWFISIDGGYSSAQSVSITNEYISLKERSSSSLGYTIKSDGSLYSNASGNARYHFKGVKNAEYGKIIYTISDTSITANSDILMELTDSGGVKAYSMEAGKITVIRDTVPTQPIPYTYKVKQTNASGQFTLVNHYVPNVPVTSVNGQTGAVTIAVPTKTSDLQNDSGFVKPTEANTFTAEQTFSNENGIKTNRVHNLNGNAWYDFDGTNDRLGSLATPTIIRTSEARPKAEVPSGTGTATKEIALLEDVQGSEWAVNNDNNAFPKNGWYLISNMVVENYQLAPFIARVTYQNNKLVIVTQDLEGHDVTLAMTIGTDRKFADAIRVHTYTIANNAITATSTALSVTTLLTDGQFSFDYKLLY